MEETVHVTFSEDDEAIFQSSTEGDGINFNETEPFQMMNSLNQGVKLLSTLAILNLPEFMDADDHPALSDHNQLESANHLESADYLESTDNLKSRVRDSEAASAHECLYVNFLSEMEPKKLTEALEEGWIIVMQKELTQFERNKGYNQQEEIDYEETFTPIARLEAIRIFLAYAAYMDFMVYRMDVKSAFLNGKISKEVYVQQPPGFESSEFPNHVCKLDKALYGLKQAPRAWYETLSKFLIQHKFVRDFKGISICQEKYVKDLLKKYDLADSASVKCPMLPLNNLGPDESGVSVNETLYQANPKESHLVAVKRIFRYLKGTPNLGLWYPKGSGFNLKAYSDSDYAGCNLDRKTEAEYVAAVGCCVQLPWIKSQLADYDVLYNKMDNTISTASFKKPLAFEVALTSHMLKVAKLFQESEQYLILSFEKVNIDDGADKSLFGTSATARLATQSLGASKSAEDQVNQPQAVYAKKKEVKESRLESMGDVTFEQIMDVYDQKNKAVQEEPESPYDTKSKIKIIKRFQPSQSADDDTQITFLGFKPYIEIDQTSKKANSDETDSGLQSMPDDDLASLSGFEAKDSDNEDSNPCQQTTL
ncbi:retrovirus-related pol polyprotein from transposon TNT 1-94 [Tanacetum coccineum]